MSRLNAKPDPVGPVKRLPCAVCGWMVAPSRDTVRAHYYVFHNEYREPTLPLILRSGGLLSFIRHNGY